MGNICNYIPTPSISVTKVNSEFSILHKALCYIESLMNTVVLMGANNGLSVSSQIAVLGQDLGDPAAPATLSSDREIPMNSNVVFFTDTSTGITTTSVGVGIANTSIGVTGCATNGASATISLSDSAGGISGKSIVIYQDIDRVVFDINNAGFAQLFSNTGVVRFSPSNDDSSSGHRLQVIGDLFIGTSNVTSTGIAYLQIGAGTTSIGSINLVAGTLTTTPQNGNLEYDGTHLYFTIAGVRHTLI